MATDSAEELRRRLALGESSRHFHSLLIRGQWPYLQRLVDDIAAAKDMLLWSKREGVVACRQGSDGGLVTEYDCSCKQACEGLSNGDVVKRRGSETIANACGHGCRNMLVMKDEKNHVGVLGKHSAECVAMEGDVVHPGTSQKVMRSKEKVQSCLASRVHGSDVESDLRFEEHLSELDDKISLLQQPCHITSLTFRKIWNIIFFRRLVQLTEYKSYNYECRLGEDSSTNELTYVETYNGRATRPKIEIPFLLMSRAMSVLDSHGFTLVQLLFTSLYYRVKEVFYRWWW